MTSEYFCPSCSLRKKNNTLREESTGANELICDCGFSMRFYIKSPSTKTFTKSQLDFLDTPLTDSQKGTKKKK